MLSESLGANVPLKLLIQKILDRQYVIVDKETVIILITFQFLCCIASISG